MELLEIETAKRIIEDKDVNWILICDRNYMEIKDDTSQHGMNQIMVMRRLETLTYPSLIGLIKACNDQEQDLLDRLVAGFFDVTFKEESRTKIGGRKDEPKSS